MRIEDARGANERVYTLRRDVVSLPCSFPRAYNTAVANPRRQNDAKHRRHAAYATETSGLLFVAFLLLVLILIRYWHAIHWSWSWR